MNSFTNNDLFTIVLNRARKDRKGGLTPEEFESFLRIRNIGYFNAQYSVDGMTQANIDSLRPFTIFNDVLTVTQEGSTGTYYVDLSYDANTTTTTTTVDPDARLSADYAHMINAFYSTSATVHSTIVELDILSPAEVNDRLKNAITKPSATSPVGYIAGDKMWVYGITSGYILLTYYTYPADPYFDYYVDASGNYTYLTEGQASYPLQSGEEARDGSVSPTAITSASIDLGWEDQDAMNILDLVMTDLGLAINDQPIVQGSLVERQNNAT